MTFLSERAAVKSVVISPLSATQRVRLKEAHIWRQPAQMRNPPATMTSGSTFMAKPRFFQYDRTTDRQIWLLELDTLPATLDLDDLHQQKFVCLCVMDASPISSDALAGFCSQLIDRGCAYFCAWGPDCERLHDIMDQRVIGDNPPETDIGCLMTTWHARESLAEAVDFFLTCTVPDEEYAPAGCPFGLAVAIGSPSCAIAMEEHIRRGLAP